MVMVLEGAVSRLCVSKEPVRSKVTESLDDMARTPTLLMRGAERRKNREAAFDAIIADDYCLSAQYLLLLPLKFQSLYFGTVDCNCRMKN